MLSMVYGGMGGVCELWSDGGGQFSELGGGGVCILNCYTGQRIIINGVRYMGDGYCSRVLSSQVVVQHQIYCCKGEGLRAVRVECYPLLHEDKAGSKVDVIELGGCVVVILTILVYRYIVRLIFVFTSLYFHPGNCAKSYIIIIIV